MAAVLGEKGKVMVKRRGADQQIEITYCLSGCPKASSFPSKHFTCFFINANHHDSAEEIVQIPLVSFGVGGVIDSLIDLRKRDDGNGWLTLAP